MSEFYRYFKENMEGLGLPAPATLFSSAQAAVGNVTVLLAHIDKFGKAVTVGEVIGAATRLEKLGVVATLSASFYTGACIGSIAVAVGRDLAGGVSIADVLMIARRHHIHRHWLASVLYRCPAIHRQSGAGKRLARYGAVSR
jgi:hypothetical protein